MATKGDPGNPKDSDKTKTRRRVAVEGEDVETKPDRPRKVTPRPLPQILGADGNDPEAAAALAAGPVWDPGRLKKFLTGQITLGDLEGITKQEQYEMAKIGHSYLQSGKLEQAKTVFNGLIALDPYDAYFLTALGSIAQQQNDLEEADRRYSRALEINPYSPVALANRGEVRVMSGRLAEGATDLVRALEEDPNGLMPSTLRARATIMVVREQLQKASPDLADAAAKSTGSKVPAVKAQAQSKAPAAKAPAPAKSTPPAKPPAAQPAKSPAAASERSPAPAASQAPERKQSTTEEPRAREAKARAESEPIPPGRKPRAQPRSSPRSPGRGDPPKKK